MRLSLVIPTWNAGPLLEEVLRAVDRQPGAGELEKLAVDSGSTDDTTTCLSDHGFRVHTIPQAEFNHGTTRDLAIDQTKGDVVLLLTQDATPADEQWLPRLTEAYDNPEVAAAYCRQIPRPDCHPLIKERILEWTAGRTEPVLQKLDDPGLWERMPPMERLRISAYDNVAGSVRRSVWQQFRFGKRPFGEDVAFGKRLVLAGHTILYEPRAAVIHSHNRTPQEEGKRIYCDHKNLKDLFGVHLIPSRSALHTAVEEGRRDFTRRIEALELPEQEKKSLRDWASQYAYESARGIYLGGNADRLERGILGFYYRALGRRLAGGI